jgi:flavin-dependent dehydrogenase
MEEKFDAIIVGAGLAGLSAAYTLAREGLEVLLLERGDYPGAKNVTGGRIYLNPIRELFPDLWKKAPFERHISQEGVSIMAGERSLNLSYRGEELEQEPYQSYSILRAKFDRWLSKQAERKGAMLVSRSRVDDLIIENGRVEGVYAGGDELRSQVVIACDGVLSLMAEKAGLRKPGSARQYGVGFKEVIELDSALINERFGLEGDEGAARLYMGEVTKGKFGGGFLYTNKESISLGIVVGIHDLMEGAPAIQAPVLLDEFKQRPEIARLIKGGETVEYSAQFGGQVMNSCQLAFILETLTHCHQYLGGFNINCIPGLGLEIHYLYSAGLDIYCHFLQAACCCFRCRVRPGSNGYKLWSFYRLNSYRGPTQGIAPAFYLSPFYFQGGHVGQASGSHELGQTSG